MLSGLNENGVVQTCDFYDTQTSQFEVRIYTEHCILRKRLLKMNKNIC